jgi:hypothetical protein
LSLLVVVVKGLGELLVMALPEGAVALFLSGPSQAIYGCVADTDVTVENPQKLVPLTVILEDMKMRAAVSDFSPCKAAMQVCLG